jgi:hypothetical protein
MFFPMGILLLMFMAERGIKKDEALVEGGDHLR